MDKQRAQEIAASPKMVRVTYEGEPIYIQHVSDASDTARVYPLGSPENEKEVALSDLKEFLQ